MSICVNINIHIEICKYRKDRQIKLHPDGKRTLNNGIYEEQWGLQSGDLRAEGVQAHATKFGSCIPYITWVTNASCITLITCITDIACISYVTCVTYIQHTTCITHATYIT